MLHSERSTILPFKGCFICAPHQLSTRVEVSWYALTIGACCWCRGVGLLAAPPAHLLLPAPPLYDGPKLLRHPPVHLPLELHHLQRSHPSVSLYPLTPRTSCCSGRLSRFRLPLKIHAAYEATMSRCEAPGVIVRGQDRCCDRREKESGTEGSCYLLRKLLERHPAPV